MKDSAGAQLAASVRLFYRKNQLATETGTRMTRSLIGSEQQSLAQLNIGQERSVVLLAVDAMQSPLARQAVLSAKPSSYQAYGYSTPQPSVATAFNGQPRDGLTGNYLLGTGYRAYNPVLMRFNSPDSWSPFGAGGLSSYGYVEGDPINNSDPSGHVKKFSYSGPGRLLGKKTLYFESFEEGSRVGNLDMHGDVGLVSFDGQKLNGRELKSALIKKNIELSDLDQFRIISCYSADGEMSVGKQFANATGLKTTAFIGRVYPTDMKLQPTKGNDKVNLANYSLATKNNFQKNHPEYKYFNYSPVAFKPEEVRNKNKKTRTQT
ncbi:RHS repeat-associated core domain-containing protein [Pseudomonas sp. NY15463]|uniref:RHS repeat-associated core domain-containing protein n=1 Tax=Pseudomonas sp. NY15463 TaxID=3400361 RepID=UPI003A839725